MKSHREYVKERTARSPRLARALEEARLEARLAVLLAQMRERRGWSQRQLAEAAGLKQPQIARIESGDQLPNLETLWKVAHALHAQVVISPTRPVSITVSDATARARR